MRAGSEYYIGLVQARGILPCHFGESIPLSLINLFAMMTVSAFGSSMVHVCLAAVLVAGSRHVAVNDVNSRYLNFYASDTLYTDPSQLKNYSLRSR